MSNDKHYVPGDFYRMCERTGFKIRASATNKEWTGRIVRNESWEARQPQDFVRGTTDDQSVPDPRPRQTDLFIGPLQTTLAASALVGSVNLTVTLTTRMFVGDLLLIILDGNADTFYTSIASIPSSTQLILANPLPHNASAGNLITDASALSLPYLGFSSGFSSGFGGP